MTLASEDIVAYRAINHDPDEMKARQERDLLRLYDAARTIGRELLVEIIASKHGPVNETAPQRQEPSRCIGIQASSTISFFCRKMRLWSGG